MDMSKQMVGFFRRQVRTALSRPNELTSPCKCFKSSKNDKACVCRKQTQITEASFDFAFWQKKEQILLSKWDRSDF